MRTLKLMMVAALAACGGMAESETEGESRIIEVRDGAPVYSDVNEGLTIEGVPEGDLGQARQPILFAPSGNRQPGFIPGSEVSCMTSGGASQNCIVPPVNGVTKGFVYYIEGGMGPRISGAGVARFDVYSQLNQVYSQLVSQGAQTSGPGALEYRETFDPADPELTFVINVGGNFCDGSSSKRHVCFTGSTTGISHDSSLVGVYHRMVNVPAIHIDYDEIRNRSDWSVTQKKNALHQAIVLAFLKGIGQGPASAPGTTRCDQTDVTTGFWCTLPANAACKLNGWGGFGEDDEIALLGADCGS